MEKKVCVFCGKEFIPKVSHQIYCSRECRENEQRQLHEQRRKLFPKIYFKYRCEGNATRAMRLANKELDEMLGYKSRFRTTQSRYKYKKIRVGDFTWLNVRNDGYVTSIESRGTGNINTNELALYLSHVGKYITYERDTNGRYKIISSTMPPQPTSSCFIATAAYGTSMAPELDILRNFRDNTLMRSMIGKKFIYIYYMISPPVAEFISKKKKLRAFVRTLIEPLIVIVMKLEEDKGGINYKEICKKLHSEH